MTPMKWFFSFLKKYRKNMILGIILTIVITSLNIVNPYISGMIVDDVITGGQYSLLYPLVGLMLLIVIIRGALRFYYQLVFETASHCMTCGTKCTVSSCRRTFPFIIRREPVTL